ncbi:FecR family protein [Kordiimonas pumila]|uniref:FecR family protein n=1 Tax=Kordiimonas pumila TaxID=2161677 RepID=A0ABV7D046_9PROT|nr:FecR domain-containing protein [Kordiimonas pumila]
MSDSNIRSLPDSAQAETEASEWVIRLQEADITPAELAAFEAWRNQSAQHKDAFERMADFWGGLDFVEKLTDYAESDAAIEPMRQDRLARRLSLVRRLMVGSIAACFLAFVAMSIYRSAFGPENIFHGSYETEVGRQEVVDLPDGSQIVLNTNSMAEITYTDDFRTIRLIRGEAYFDVAPNKSRPFSVQTKKGTVTAVGTAFSVRVSEAQLDVIVAHGRVALEETRLDDKPQRRSDFAGNQEKPSMVEVSAGQSAVIGRGVEEISLIAPLALNKELDWRDGELSFNGETLAQVVDEISRYTDISIEIGDDSLKHQRIVAYYKIGDVERMFEALNVMANIQVERLDEGHVRLYRAS